MIAEVEGAFTAFRQEVALIESEGRTAASTFDVASDFFGLPHDDFTAQLRSLRDEVEQRAYLAIVAASEAVLQVDIRARARGKSSALLYGTARSLLRNEDRQRNGRRIVVEDVLDAWRKTAGARAAVSQFKQLLEHRHWLAHGRHFPHHESVPGDPTFAYHRSRALFAELTRLDESFPRR